jgi:hypothetical protein
MEPIVPIEAGSKRIRVFVSFFQIGRRHLRPELVKCPQKVFIGCPHENFFDLGVDA